MVKGTLIIELAVFSNVCSYGLRHREANRHADITTTPLLCDTYSVHPPNPLPCGGALSL